MSASQAAGRDAIRLPPSGMAVAFRAQFHNGVSIFLWGPPGVAKSAVTRQVATAMGVAFIDLRLSQIEPTDLSGIPHLVDAGGLTGVQWSPPLRLPRDLDFSFFRDCEPIEEEVHFYNPLGENGIHYCTNPVVEVRSITPGTIARVVVEAPQGGVTPIASRVRLMVPPRSDFGDDGAIAEGTTADGDDGLPILYNRRLNRITVALYRLQDGEPTDEMVAGRYRIKLRGDARGILALEEFNSAAQSVQTAAYSLVLDRYVGEYHVPAGVSIVAMGNRETDRGIVYRMATPVANRFDHLHMDTDTAAFFPDWLQWATEAMVWPEVIAYLSVFKEDLFRFDPNSQNTSFPTPRTWEMVSKILHHAEHLTPAVERAKIVGAVGSGVAFKFLQFRRLAAQLPNVGDILEGRIKKIGKMPEPRQAENATTEDSEGFDKLTGATPVVFSDKVSVERHGVALQYALATTLCYELRARLLPLVKRHGVNYTKVPGFKDWLVLATNFMAFLTNPSNFQKEIAIMAVRAAVQTYRMPFDPKHMPAIREFTAKNSSLLVWK